MGVLGATMEREVLVEEEVRMEMEEEQAAVVAIQEGHRVTTMSTRVVGVVDRTTLARTKIIPLDFRPTGTGLLK